MVNDAYEILELSKQNICILSLWENSKEVIQKDAEKEGIFAYLL